jgi:O-antigen ligase
MGESTTAIAAAQFGTMKIDMIQATDSVPGAKPAQLPIILVALFASCYLAVLPMADTIALRNLALVLLSLALAWHFFKMRPLGRIAPPLIFGLWSFYLVIFPFIADSRAIAFENLIGQWGRGIWAMLAGAGVAAILFRRRLGTAFHLGLLSGVPILVYLSLFIWKAWTTSSMPWGYWGRETHHADIGYAAGQTVVLLSVAVVAGRSGLRSTALLIILASLMSTIFARSRAGLAFCVIGGALVFATAYLIRARQNRLVLLAGLAGIFLVGALGLAFAFHEDARWRNMTLQLASGFQGDAIQIQCEGTASIEAGITAKYGPGEQAESVIASVRDGDGARTVVLRAGLALALKHPWGSDGSRQAFQKLLKQECAQPAISMAHAHNGWIDTMLALGWVGGVLYLWLLLHLFTQGFSRLYREKKLDEWALVLVALSGFWILRGFTDSIFRDHMLEMQGFVLSYALVMVKMNALKYANSSPENAKERLQLSVD